ncbi:MAG: OsmC family peroxiredoxin, partial [Mesorhizobium sp.]
AEGDVDLRGTLGVTEGVSVGFKEIRLRFDIESDVEQSRLTQLMELTDRYCVIFQTIQHSPKTFVKLNRVVS